MLPALCRTHSQRTCCCPTGTILHVTAFMVTADVDCWLGGCLLKDSMKGSRSACKSKQCCWTIVRLLMLAAKLVKNCAARQNMHFVSEYMCADYLGHALTCVSIQSGISLSSEFCAAAAAAARWLPYRCASVGSSSDDSDMLLS